MDLEPQLKRYRSDWMELSDAPIDFIDHDDYHAKVDKNYDWNKQNDLFTNEQIELMQDCWLERQKTFDDILTDTSCPIIYRNQLNKMQKFAFDLIQEYSVNNKQLFMIINGGAGTGK
jgi:hypothetical protein